MERPVGAFTPERLKTVLKQPELQDEHFDNLKRPGLHAASVLVPILLDEGVWQFLFTKRSETVNDHKGQVSFPGGRVEKNDTSFIQCALREASEEIGLSQSDAKVLGTLSGFQTVSNYWVIPVVAEINWPIKLNLSSDEVSRVFTIPVSWFLDVRNLQIKESHIDAGIERRVIYYRTFREDLVWGITARIIFGLLNML